METTHIFDRTVEKLHARGLPTAEWYTIPKFAGYQVMTGLPAADVHCIEAYLGPSHNKPDYDSYAMVQTFDPRYPSLAITTLVERRKTDKAPSSEPSIYNRDIDFKFAKLFLPVMNSALNDLDPTGQSKGLLVQSYHAKLTLGDLIQSSSMSMELLLRFKRDGQLANIAVDYADPLIKMIANGLRPFLGLVGNIHFFPRTETLSTIEMPIRNPNGGYYTIGDNSTALEEGIKLAQTYFDKHYQTIEAGLKVDAAQPTSTI